MQSCGFLGDRHWSASSAPLIGGFIGGLIKKPADGAMFHPAGILMSIVGAVILLMIL